MSLLLKNALILFGANNISGDMNSVALAYKAAALKNTRFGDGTDNKIGGLKDISISCKGFYDINTDAAMFSDVAQPNVLTLASLTTEGSVAFFLNVMESQYDTGAKVGDNMPFSLTADAQGDLIRGIIAANKSGIVATGTGTGFNLGAVSNSQSLWAAMHVLSVAGTAPSITMEIEGDTSNAFAAPTNVLTFAAQTGAGALFASAAGALAKTWYRASWTISGTSPVFAFVLAMGIQ